MAEKYDKFPDYNQFVQTYFVGGKIGADLIGGDPEVPTDPDLPDLPDPPIGDLPDPIDDLPPGVPIDDLPSPGPEEPVGPLPGFGVGDPIPGNVPGY